MEKHNMQKQNSCIFPFQSEEAATFAVPSGAEWTERGPKAMWHKKVQRTCHQCYNHCQTSHLLPSWTTTVTCGWHEKSGPSSCVILHLLDIKQIIGEQRWICNVCPSILANTKLHGRQWPTFGRQRGFCSSRFKSLDYTIMIGSLLFNDSANFSLTPSAKMSGVNIFWRSLFILFHLHFCCCVQNISQLHKTRPRLSFCGLLSPTSFLWSMTRIHGGETPICNLMWNTQWKQRDEILMMQPGNTSESVWCCCFVQLNCLKAHFFNAPWVSCTCTTVTDQQMFLPCATPHVGNVTVTCCFKFTTCSNTWIFLFRDRCCIVKTI